MNLPELENLLGQLTLPDTAVIRSATDTLNKQYLKSPACVPALVEIMCKSARPEVRQMAAVLLRKRITKLWSRLDATTQAQLKKILLETLLAEQVNLVRHAVAAVVSSIAKFEVPANKWKELLDFLYSCCNHQNGNYREVGMFLLSTLIEPIAEQLRPHFPHLFSLFGQAMRDPENVNVRVLACQCLDDLAGFLTTEDEINMFRNSIPSMVEVINGCLKNGDEENAVRVFEVFDNLIECEVPVLSKAIPSLAQLFLEIASNGELEGSTRMKGLNFIYWIIQYKKKAIQRYKLIEPILQALLPLVAEESEDDEDEDELSQGVAQMASHTIDLMALNFPPEQVIPLTLQTVQAFIQNPAPNFRRGAMITVAVIIEGSSEFLRPHLPSLVNLCLLGLRDPNQETKEAACLAVEQLSVHIQPEVTEFHAQLLPALFEIMNDPSPRVIEKSCMALEAFCENLGSGILPYLLPLMEKLVYMLQHGNLKTQETVICAIGSTAHAAGKDFLPFFPKVTDFLKSAMNITNPDELQLRSLATDTLGSVAVAVGKEAFASFLPEAMRLGIEGAAIEDSYLRECTWSFFTSLAKLYQADFAPYMPVIIPLLFESCLSEDGLEVIQNEEEFEDDEDDEEEGDANISVATSFLQEKEMACVALGEIFGHVGESYLPFFEKGLEVLKMMVEYFHADVRQAAVTSYCKNLLQFHTMFDGYDTWEPSVNTPVHENVLKLIHVVVPVYLKLMKEEPERSVVTEVCSSFRDIIHKIGPVVIQGGVANELAQQLQILLTKQATCQTQDHEEEDPEESATLDEEEEAEIDAHLIDEVAEVIGAMATVMQGSFAPYFGVFYGHILKYYKATRPVADRSMAIGCFAEVVAGMKEAVAPHADELFKVFMKGLSDDDDEVRSNAAYGIGVLCEVLGTNSVKYYPQALQKIHSLFLNHAYLYVVDNACGAVARMIVANPSSIPLAQVLPVFFSALPLKMDYAENKAVFNCLFFLFGAQPDMMFAHLPSLFAIFSSVLGLPENQLTTETRVGLLSLIHSVSTQRNDLFTQAMASLNEHQRNVLLAALKA